MRGILVTGTDTGVGKTLVSAWLMRHWPAAVYWKPVQAGLEEETDSQTVARLAALPSARVLPEGVRLQAPMSPADAARREGRVLCRHDLRPPVLNCPILVEGAGGVLVPLADDWLLVDLMAALGLPVLVVTRSTLGTLNHTLLTLEALHGRGLTVAGLILNGPPHPENHTALEHWGGVPVLAHLPRFPIPPDAATLAAHPLPAPLLERLPS